MNRKKFNWHYFSSLQLSKQMIVAVLAIVVLGSHGVKLAQARETYVQHATRLLSQPPEGAGVRDDLEALVLQATNAYRASKRLPALKPASATLLQAARAHAMDLLMSGRMGHTASTGHGFESRMRAFHDGQMVLAAMAENAARVRNPGLTSAQKAQRLVQMWVGSSGHRKNMVNRTYTAVAIGVVARGDDVYSVQIFTGPTVKTNMWGKRTPVAE
jgi:uncharacterized protein YkwD